ncbi:MAG: hypothetical protein U0S36_02760 [Candidatus Nanopelagicales bacterium]
MDLTPYLDDLRTQLVTAAEPAGPEARALAERLTAALESSYRLALLDALSVAAAEITSELAPGSVEVRLRGRDPEFVVALPAPVEPAPVAPAPVHVPDDDAAMTRINLRLDQVLKDRVEDAAKASGLSVNAWLVRAASAALATGTPTRTTPRGGESYRGWVR